MDIHKVALIVHCIWIELEFEKCWFLRRGENRSTQRKTSRSREENQQQTQPTYDAQTGNRTRATLVGGECSLTPPSLLLDEREYVKILYLNGGLKNEDVSDHRSYESDFFSLNFLRALFSPLLKQCS